jgi:glycosyltransferase involved in cell wall biosynthesis
MSTDINTHFKIIVPMYDCAKWAVGCLNSVLNQTYKNWQLVVAVEPSTDGTFEVVKEYLEKQEGSDWLLFRNETRKHVPKNHVDCIVSSAPSNDDVIVCLDGDDKFYGNDVLQYLASVYEDENIWITWGSYIVNGKGPRGAASQPIPEPRKDPYRGKRWWRYSHLKTFRYFLFKGILDEDLWDLESGNYYTVAGDVALMFPMVEMAGRNHSRYIDKILYDYNRSTPNNDDKLYNALCKKMDLQIRNRLRYPEMTKTDLCGIGL